SGRYAQLRKFSPPEPWAARRSRVDARHVVAAERLMKMGTRDGSLPSLAAGLIFEPDNYLLGLGQDESVSSLLRDKRKNGRSGDQPYASQEGSPVFDRRFNDHAPRTAGHGAAGTRVGHDVGSERRSSVGGVP